MAITKRFASEEYVTESVTAVEERVTTLETETSELHKEKVNLPKDSEGNIQNGTVGQFAVSDGQGGITWVDIENGNEVSY